jgi:hypothetical protein
MANRRAALEGLGRILDAGAPEDLFTGSDEEASFLYELLEDTARARASSHYWEICRTARRRGVTPEYVVDRAAVLLAAIVERRRTDLYRVLGVPPLASGEMIRERWLLVAKRLHPDTGGDAAGFRQAKQAYEVLRDAGRRAEYERFWLRALGPFERVAPADETLIEAQPRTPEPAPEEPPTSPYRAALDASARSALRTAVDRPVGMPGGGVSALLDRVAAALAPVEESHLRTLASEIDVLVTELETVREQLHSIAELKRVLQV